VLKERCVLSMHHAAQVMSSTQVPLFITHDRPLNQERPSLWTEARKMVYHDTT
jgi:hypothetical protein